MEIIGKQTVENLTFPDGFVSLQGVKPRFCNCGPKSLHMRAHSPQPATAGPATAKRGFTISITVFCRVRTNKKQRSKALFIFPAFPEQPVENIRIYAQELQRNYGTYAEQYAG